MPMADAFILGWFTKYAGSHVPLVMDVNKDICFKTAKGEYCIKFLFVMDGTHWRNRLLLRAPGLFGQPNHFGAIVFYSELPFNKRHQLIKPPQSRLPNLIALQMHHITLLGGPQLMIMNLGAFLTTTPRLIFMESY